MITTITLNPALDRLLSVDRLEPGETNRVRRLADSPAGKGIDVAKALRCLGCGVKATGFLGGDIAYLFTGFFAKEGIQDCFIPIHGTTRTNIQIFGDNGKRTELLECGPEILPEEWESLLITAQELAEQSLVVTVNGSVPEGVSPEQFRMLIHTVKERGATVIADTSGPFLRAAIEERPALIKPNRDEMRELMGAPDADDDAMIEYAKQLVKTSVPYVLISLGRDGALLVCEKGIWHGMAPDVSVKSTLGCGDTMVASLALSFEQGHDPATMLKNAIALSTANVMTFETARILPLDYENILKITSVEQR